MYVRISNTISLSLPPLFPSPLLPFYPSLPPSPLLSPLPRYCVQDSRFHEPMDGNMLVTLEMLLNLTRSVYRLILAKCCRRDSLFNVVFLGVFFRCSVNTTSTVCLCICSNS